MGDKIMIWTFVDFIKKIAINVGIHICWFMTYMIMDGMSQILGTGIINDFLYELGYLYWEYIYISIPITTIIFIHIIIKVYRKNPCEKKLEKCIYWILSTLQSLGLIIPCFFDV